MNCGQMPIQRKLVSFTKTFFIDFWTFGVILYLFFIAGKEIQYVACGSSCGKREIVENIVDFAGSDSALSDEQYEEAPDLQMYDGFV